MDQRFINVLILGFGFMFLFTAFQTMGNIEKTVLDSIHADDPTFTGDGYISLAIIYAVFAVCNWIAPPVISITGPRCAMLIGAVAYCLFMVSFLWPKTYLLYTVSAMLGVGAAIIWTAQGSFLSRCSDATNISRNSGIFWAMLQMSMFFGNLFVYFQFQGKTHIDEETRTLVFSVLIGVGILGFFFLTALRPLEDTRVVNGAEADDELDNPQSGVKVAFQNSVKLFFTKEMMLLSLTFFYTGLELSFFSGVYSPSIGFTTAIGESAKQLVGLSGIFIGIGEVFGGVAFGLLGAKASNKLGRDPIVILGFIIHIIAFFLIFLNIPNLANFGDTADLAYFDPPLPSVALLCSFLLGFGDSCFNTQIYSMLGGAALFKNRSVEAFSIFKFTQSVAAALSFIYSTHWGLRVQMVILVVTGVAGTVAFYTVEWAEKRKQEQRDEMIKSSDSNIVPSP